MTGEAAPPRMFDNQVLEWGSKTPSWLPPLLYLPLIAWVVQQAIMLHEVEWLAFTGLLVIGLLVWSITEYVVHRFLFHLRPDGPRARRVVRIIHGFHHEHPDDHTRLVLPLIVTLPFAIALVPIAWLLFGPIAWGFSAGFGLGYVGYDLTHALIHRSSGFRGLAYQRRNHMRHHFTDDSRSFGVSSPLWDYVFGTAPER